MPKLATVTDHRADVQAAERRLAGARTSAEALQGERAALEDLMQDSPRRLTAAIADAAENPGDAAARDRLRTLRARLAEAPKRLDAMPALIAAAAAELAEAEAGLATARREEAAAAVPALTVQRVRAAERIDALLADLAGAWGEFAALGDELRARQDTLGAGEPDVDAIHLGDAVKRHVPLALALGMEPDRSFDLNGYNFERRSTANWPDLRPLATAAAA